MATATDEIEDIRRRMAQIRHELHIDVQSVVDGAEAATDWKRYLTMYPWASVGVALAVGYLIVPRKHKPTVAIVRQAIAESPVAAAAASHAREDESKKKKGWGLMGAVFGMLAPVGMRLAQGYAVQYLENWMAQHPLINLPPGMMPGGGMPPGQGQAPGYGPPPGYGPGQGQGPGPGPGQHPGQGGGGTSWPRGGR